MNVGDEGLVPRTTCDACDEEHSATEAPETRDPVSVLLGYNRVSFGHRFSRGRALYRGFGRFDMQELRRTFVRAGCTTIIHVLPVHASRLPGMREVSLLRAILADATAQRSVSGTFVRVVLDAHRLARLGQFDGAPCTVADACDALFLAQSLTIDVTISDAASKGTYVGHALSRVEVHGDVFADEHVAEADVVEADIDVQFTRWLDAAVTGVLDE